MPTMEATSPRMLKSKVVMAAHQLTLHAETYNMPLPPSLAPQVAAGVDGKNKPQVILDPE